MRETYRLPETADIIGVSPKALGNWLGRYESVAPTAERRGVWPEFSIADIALFAVIAELVAFGVPAPVAFDIARGKVLDHPKHRGVFETWCRAGAPTADAVKGAFANRVLVITRRDGKAHGRVDDWKNIAAFGTGPNAALLLDLGECIAAVMARVRSR